jgi:hypothetical protein
VELTRYWRAQYSGSNIEVQWTGFRPRGGWVLRLLVDGVLKAERRVGRFADNFEVRDGPIIVNFWGKPFRRRCKISANGVVLADRAQPWNALAFCVIFAPAMVMLLVRGLVALLDR